MTPTAYVLVGPTAVGKSSVAHYLAQQLDLPVISADSMAVYRGMDIGTAKPSAAERAEVAYHGIDLVDPSEDFSTGDWLSALPRLPLCIVAGGTGLYVKALLHGLHAGVAADEALRAELADAGVSELQRRLASIDPVWLDSLSDPENPRRLIRAIERAASGEAPPVPVAREALPEVHGLARDPDALRKRIRTRVDGMFDAGLIDEAAALATAFPEWSKTAAGAIGYREALRAKDGELDPVDREAVVTRTNQLAKRQRTWFRNQLRVVWTEVEDDDSIEDVAERVRAAWERSGPVELVGLAD